MTTIALSLLIVASVVLLLLILSGRRIRKAWLLLWGISPVIIVYLLNPGFRVYSFHSFMHAGIVYQILNGNLPPYDPLVAGHIVHYPWGAHIFAAGISNLIKVTPFYSLAIMNVVSLFLAMVLTYKISQLLIRNEIANILSVIIPIFGITIMIPEFFRLLPDSVPTEIRGIPILSKFITVNTLPVGLVFFLLALYSAIKLFQSRNPSGKAVGLLISTLATGFFYPAFLPGIAASILLGAVVAAGLHAFGVIRSDLRRILFIVATLVVSLLVLRPYLFSIGAGTVSQMEIFNSVSVAKNTIKYLVVVIPIVVIILINRASLINRLERQGLYIVITVIVSTLGSYIFIHLPFDNEYKLLLLSTVAIGILGGIAFGSMLKSYNRLAVSILLILFLIPSFRIVRLRASRGRAIPSTYVERGISVESADEEENELYRWIRENTASNSVFVDTELEIPVLAQRQLFIGTAGKRRRDKKGHGAINIILQVQSGYDSDLLGRRKRLVDDIYGPQSKIARADLEELLDLPGSAYVVARTQAAKDKLDREGYREVFKSSTDAYRLYEVRPSD